MLYDLTVSTQLLSLFGFRYRGRGGYRSRGFVDRGGRGYDRGRGRGPPRDDRGLGDTWGPPPRDGPKDYSRYAEFVNIWARDGTRPLFSSGGGRIYFYTGILFGENRTKTGIPKIFGY